MAVQGYGTLDALTVATAVAALALAAGCGWAAYRDQPTKDWHFIGMAVVTLLAVIQLVVGIVQLARGEKPDQGTTIFVAYLLGAFACIPAAGFMSLAERTRWGSITVAAGGAPSSPYWRCGSMTSGEAEMTATEENGTAPQENQEGRESRAIPEKKRTRLISGPGMLLLWLYGVMVVGAVSRSAVQISTEFKAPLAYSLSAVAGLVYGFITYSLVRGGETARRAALVCCAAELVGVLTVGTWTLVSASCSRRHRVVGLRDRLSVHPGAAAAVGHVLVAQGAYGRPARHSSGRSPTSRPAAVARARNTGARQALVTNAPVWAPFCRVTRASRSSTRSVETCA